MKKTKRMELRSDSKRICSLASSNSNPLVYPEILENVFSHLSLESLQSCRQVCSIWNKEALRLVSDHSKCTLAPVVHKKEHIKDAVESANSILGLLKKPTVDSVPFFRNMTITNNYMSLWSKTYENKLIHILKHAGPTMRSLELRNTRGRRREPFVLLPSLCPNLEILTIETGYSVSPWKYELNESTRSQWECGAFPFLTTLHVILMGETSNGTLELLLKNATTIRHLRVDLKCWKESNEIEVFENNAEVLHNLETLELRVEFCHSDFMMRFSDIPNLRFNTLKSLTLCISSMTATLPLLPHEFAIILTAAKDTLEYLSIRNPAVQYSVPSNHNYLIVELCPMPSLISVTLKNTFLQRSADLQWGLRGCWPALKDLEMLKESSYRINDYVLYETYAAIFGNSPIHPVKVHELESLRLEFRLLDPEFSSMDVVERISAAFPLIRNLSVRLCSRMLDQVVRKLSNSRIEWLEIKYVANSTNETASLIAFDSAITKISPEDCYRLLFCEGIHGISPMEYSSPLADWKHLTRLSLDFRAGGEERLKMDNLFTKFCLLKLKSMQILDLRKVDISYRSLSLFLNNVATKVRNMKALNMEECLITFDSTTNAYEGMKNLQHIIEDKCKAKMVLNLKDKSP